MLADSVLILHFALVLFVVAGALLIWLGIALHWQWVRARLFRVTHLGLIGFVAVQSLLGLTCPLTLLEDHLRGRQGETGFIARWLHRWLFYSAPEWVFAAIYVAFAALVALTYWRFPPRKP